MSYTPSHLHSEQARTRSLCLGLCNPCAELDVVEVDARSANQDMVRRAAPTRLRVASRALWGICCTVDADMRLDEEAIAARNIPTVCGRLAVLQRAVRSARRQVLVEPELRHALAAPVHRAPDARRFARDARRPVPVEARLADGTPLTAWVDHLTRHHRIVQDEHVPLKSIGVSLHERHVAASRHV